MAHSRKKKLQYFAEVSGLTINLKKRPKLSITVHSYPPGIQKSIQYLRNTLDT